MRLRMPKTQAKIIILVIWSAALMTSLPTALLSSLTPASPDYLPPSVSSTIEPTLLSSMPASISPESTTPSVSQASNHNNNTETTLRTPNHSEDLTSMKRNSSLAVQSPPAQTLANPTNESLTKFNLKQPSTSTAATVIDANRLNVSSNADQMPLVHSNEQELDEQRKYFCQESWTFWPKGKYYYSMALMVLQFVLPLFVLVITYSLIVIAVWGKRMPGEENDARDARMARSKRKVSK